jgi:hypothetical protein
MAIYGCVRALVTAVVAVMVAVRDNADFPHLRRGVE